MNVRAFLLFDVLVAFLVFTLWVIESVGYAGFFAQTLASPVGIQLLVDLVISLSLALIWMRGDSKTHGIPFAPYLVLTLVLGSVGLLAYLLHREVRSRRVTSRAAAPAVARP
jgi:hypothetical protein